MTTVFNVEPNLVKVLAALFLALIVGSVIRVVRARRLRGSQSRQKMESLVTWWVLFALFSAAVLAGRWGIAAFMAIAGALGLREYFYLANPYHFPAAVKLLAFLCLVSQYTLIGIGWLQASLVFVPVFGTIVLTTYRVCAGSPKRYLSDVSSMQWGNLLLVYLLSHTAMLAALPPESNDVAGSAGWVVFLVFLTQINDIAQSQWGRRFGRKRISPTVSPNKTWEGFLGGVVTTVVVALPLGAALTPLLHGEGGPAGFRYLWAPMAGLIIAVSGFLGDLGISAIKRDSGVKDSGAILPGQGGILDRVDSLTFTAPCFFYYVVALYGW